jgi:hypothetical protein
LPTLPVHSRGQGEYARPLWPKDLQRQPSPAPTLTSVRVTLVTVIFALGFLTGLVCAVLCAHNAAGR